MPLPSQIPALLLLVMSKVSSLSQTAVPPWPHWQACSAVGCAGRAAVGLPLQLHLMEPLTNSVMHRVHCKLYCFPACLPHSSGQ